MAGDDWLGSKGQAACVVGGGWGGVCQQLRPKALVYLSHAAQDIGGRRQGSGSEIEQDKY